jgi:uncharacterized membrane protein YeiH
MQVSFVKDIHTHYGELVLITSPAAFTGAGLLAWCIASCAAAIRCQLPVLDGIVLRVVCGYGGGIKTLKNNNT